MQVQVYNTMARRKETLTPGEPGHVRMYVCGPTVYDLSHIGHARVYVAFDTISRFLRRHYKVTYVRNFTDVDDKIIKRALANGESPTLLAERFIKEFEADMQLLGCGPVDAAPKVTEHIGEIVGLIAELIAKGAAYQAGGDVYFAVQSFADYGKLGRRSLEDMEAGARVEVSKIKRHPMDFALWKAAKPGEICWDSPWGSGRPGWHIECSAMSR
ncbi:MAG: cysteine--tRNA ligase, partial [Deltaproteobacteria bacterium]